jgi:hypothetical protein
MSRITDWSAVILNPAFWAGYYFMQLELDDEEDHFEVLEVIFGCDMDALDAFNTTLRSLDALPEEVTNSPALNVLTIPFPDDYTWRIVFNTVPGIYHYLCHPSFASPLLLGYDDPHFMLPILRRAEVAPLAACARQHGQVTFDPRALYLLFYPLMTLTEADDLDAARDELTQAWAEFGLLAPDQVASLVARVTWVDADIHWRRDETLGWITGAPHSYRNPDNGWRPTEFAQWNAFLVRVLQERDGERGG